MLYGEQWRIFYIQFDVVQVDNIRSDQSGIYTDLTKAFNEVHKLVEKLLFSVFLTHVEQVMF